MKEFIFDLTSHPLDYQGFVMSLHNSLVLSESSGIWDALLHLFLNSFPFLSMLLFTSSAECQRSDWNAGHKLKCKVVKSTTGLKASLFGNGSASKTALSPKLSQIIKPGDVMSHLLLI